MLTRTISLTIAFLATTVIPIKATVHTANSASAINNLNLQPGDTVLLDPAANWADQQINLDVEGSENAWIVIDGQGIATLSGSALLRIGGKYTEVTRVKFQNCASTEGDDLVKFKSNSNAENCRLSHCYFKDNNPASVETGYKWVSLYGKYNRVDHCWFEGKRHRGTTLVVWLDNNDPLPNYHQIDHNYFTRPVYTAGNNEAESIRIGDSSTSLIHSYTKVEFNYFEECDGEIESISNKSCYNEYRHNTFFNNASILTLRHGHYCTVESNYFFGNNTSGGGGVRLIGVGHKVINNYFHQCAGSGNLRGPIVLMGGVNGYDVNDATNRYVAAQDCEVRFNTIVDCKQGIYVGSDKSKSGETYDAPFDNTIANNIIYNTDNDALAFEYSEIASFTYEGNIHFGNNLGLNSTTGFTKVDPELTAWSDTIPAFLMSNSPAIDAAAAGSFPAVDIQGHSRDANPDVGCDEYSDQQSEYGPIQKNQVGPCWLHGNDCELSEPLEDDCAGTPGGSAEYDDCGICSGGSTGIPVDDCLSCEPVVASSDDGNIPANTLDMDLMTRWSAQGDGQWIQYCFDEVTALTNIGIAFYKGDLRTTTFSVEYSLDGVDWVSALTSEVSSGLTEDYEVFELPSTIQAKKVRIIGHGNSDNDWNSILDVQWNMLVTSIKQVRADIWNDQKIHFTASGFKGLLGQFNVYSLQGQLLLTLELSGNTEIQSMELNASGPYIWQLVTEKGDAFSGLLIEQ